MRINVADFRSPPRWSKTDRQRPCERAIVSIAWDRSPFGIRDTLVMPNVQPGVWRVNGTPVQTENEYMGEWGDLVDNADWHLQVDGKPGAIWTSGAQSLTAVDLTQVDVVEHWVAHIVEHFAWAGGVSLDYFSNLAWLFPTIPLSYWHAYDLGLAHAVLLLRRERPDWHINARQYHTTPITHYPDSLFIEEGIGHFEGQTFDTVRADMDAHGGGGDWILELNNPNQQQANNPEFVRKMVEIVKERGCLMSWGRDSEAGYMVPA